MLQQWIDHHVEQMLPKVVLVSRCGLCCPPERKPCIQIDGCEVFAIRNNAQKMSLGPDRGWFCVRRPATFRNDQANLETRRAVPAFIGTPASMGGFQSGTGIGTNSHRISMRIKHRLIVERDSGEQWIVDQNLTGSRDHVHDFQLREQTHRLHMGFVATSSELRNC